MGNGLLSHAAQDKNVVLVKYRIPEKPGFMENSIVHYTHAHFPRDAMDEVSVEGNHAFGRLGHKYVAFIAKYPLHWASDSRVDSIVVDTDYPRIDSPWALVERDPQTITITHGDEELFLDFYSMIREQRPRSAP